MLNENAARIVEEMIQHREHLGITFHDDGVNVPVMDCGVERRGSLGAGIYLARVCTAGFAEIRLESCPAGLPSPSVGAPVPQLSVRTDQPLAACMASQYAGWRVAHEDFFAMASGPMRALAGREELFDAIGYRESSPVAVGVLESSELPSPFVCRKIANECDVEHRSLTLLVAPTTSLAGTVQIVARSIETAMHKLHELGFDLKRVVSGWGTAPLPPVRPDSVDAIGVTNDAILYGGQVTLWVDCDDAAIESVIEQVPSSASSQYGQPFADLFRAVEGDFYAVDPLLFSPAAVRICSVASGRTFTAGSVEWDILKASFA